MNTTRRAPRRRFALGAITALSLLAAACGGDDSSSATTAATGSTTVTTSAPATTTEAGAPTTAAASPESTDPSAGGDAVEGCGPEAVTDLSVIAHEPARCAPGAPAAQPLAERTKITLGAATTAAEYMAPIMIGLAKGEFEQENIDLEIVTVPSTDALQLMSQGKLDADMASPDGAFFNAVSQGFEIRWVAANFSVSADSKTGLWAKSGVTIEDLKGASIGSVVGPGSTTMYPIAEALSSGGLSVADVSMQRFDGASLNQALANDAVMAAWVLDPRWVELDEDDAYVFLQGQTLGEPLGGLTFGPNLLEKNREAGEAFIRAYVRIINTYFAGDYKSDPAFVAELSEALGVPAEVLEAVPSNVWDWEIREGTTQRIQAAILQQPDTLQYDEPLPESELVDRSFYLRAVGAPS